MGLSKDKEWGDSVRQARTQHQSQARRPRSIPPSPTPRVDRRVTNLFLPYVRPLSRFCADFHALYAKTKNTDLMLIKGFERAFLLDLGILFIYGHSDK